MNNGSTSYVAQLRQNFQIDPIGFRVELPNGSLAVVRQVVDDHDGRLLRVQGVGRNGRLCKLPKGVHHWYRPDELVIRYFTASVRSDWAQS